MAYVIALLMAALSFLLNRAALRYIGVTAVITYGPVLEELAKTVLAFYLGADILLTHVTFGVIEGVYDWATASNRRLAAAALSILGHSLFGALTTATLAFSGSVLAAVIVGSLVHLVWNVTVIRLTA
ncbi:MAG TPA: hypothetical protein PKA10_15950 [Selenomonadales bacterium]|nr:hypothetical protein [Selenomonadales bacterium]